LDIGKVILRAVVDNEMNFQTVEEYFPEEDVDSDLQRWI